MIWVAGKIVPDDELRISVLDRTFEHGLGLFETLRTWNGRATLLRLHLERMCRSAMELGLPLDLERLPTQDAVANLLKADGFEHDAMLRITVSGALSSSSGSVVWMRCSPLPYPLRRDGAVVSIATEIVSPNDPLARHKSLNYWSRRLAFERAQALGYDEVLNIAPAMRCLEGSRTNLFIATNEALFTPSLDNPIVPGVMRGLVMDVARDMPLRVEELPGIEQVRLLNAKEVFLTNSVRGIIPVSRIGEMAWPAPGKWTQLLSVRISDMLEGGPP